MSVLVYAVGIVVGLVGLWWSSDRSVRDSVKLSDVFGLTKFFIGFVLMAVATGFPELAIAIASLWKGVPQIAVGDIIGSNLVDVSLVLGLPAILLGTLNVKKEEKIPLILMLLVTALVMGFIFTIGSIGLVYGIILVCLYFVSIWWLWRTKAIRIITQEEAIAGLGGVNKLKKKPLIDKLFAIAKLFFSLALVVVFSKISVDCAVFLSRFFSLSPEVIGATVLAVGTSLPELALTFQSVRRKEYDLAFGNSFGSVLEQATLILGILAIGAQGRLDISVLRSIAPIMFLAYAVVAHSLLKKTKVGRQEGLGRKEGFMLVGLFLAHVLYFLVFKGG